MRSRRLAAALVVASIAALTTAAVPVTPAIAQDCPARESNRHPIDRVAGESRYDTAVCASRAQFDPGRGGSAVIARGDNAGGWADALAGTVLAGAEDAPMLLTDPRDLPDVVGDELQRLLVGHVFVLGGPGAISESVVDEIRRAVPTATVERVAGESRFATAVAVSERAGASERAFVVNGFRPADALVAGAPAARSGSALLLVDRRSVPDVTREALRTMDSVVIVGGYGVVSEQVERELARMVGWGKVRRVSGSGRSETAASVARAFPAGSLTYIVAGADASLVDAISAGWSAARDGGGAVLYSGRNRPGAGTDRHLRLGGLAPKAPMRLVGGTGVLSTELVDRLEDRYVEAASGGPRPQMRAVWAHLFDDTLKSRPSIDAMLDDAATANLNTVIVEVVRRQDAYYASDVLPRTTDPALPPGLDIVDRITKAAHDRGLEVHAWVPVAPTYHGSYDSIPHPEDWVYDEHGPTAPTSRRWVTRRADGRWFEYLDMGVPAVHDHIVAIYRELADDYPIDAVHFDYLRYPGAEYGYHPVALDRFRRETGFSGTPAPSDAQWSDWRRSQTRRLARRIADAVREVAPEVGISVAGSTMGEGPRSTTSYSNTRTWNDVFQTWPDWLRDGTVDAVFPMNYFREGDSTQRRWFDQWVAFEERLARNCNRPTGCVVAVGQGSYLNSPSGSLAQLRQALGATDGAVVYSYQQNAAAGSRSDALLDALPTTLFGEPAPAPALR